MKKTLIAGGMGYIGSFTCSLIKKKLKSKVISIDNLSRSNLNAKKYCINKKLDINNLYKIKKILNHHNISKVLNLSSYTCVRESINKPAFYKKNNLIKQKKFINLVKKCKVKHFIFASSMSVYEKNKISKNLSPYSSYKLQIEKYLKQLSSRDFKVTILRYPNVTGASEDGKLGDKNNKISRIFRIFYEKMIKGKKITLYKDFKKKKYPIRNYAHVIDIAKLNYLFLKKENLPKKNFEIYDVLSDVNLTNYYIAKKMNKLLKTKMNIEFLQIDKNENLEPISYSKTNFKKYLKFKFKNSNSSFIFKSNIKWFGKIIK